MARISYHPVYASNRAATVYTDSDIRIGLARVKRPRRNEATGVEAEEQKSKKGEGEARQMQRRRGAQKKQGGKRANR